jgi:starch synthase (maltosyl-transferring)
MGSSARAQGFPEEGRRRIYIEQVQPEIDGGRFPIKRIIGDELEVFAVLVADGHDRLGGAVLYRHDDDTEWREAPLAEVGWDRWGARFELDAIGRWRYTVEAWPQTFVTWQRALEARVGAGQDVEIELEVGARLIEAAERRADHRDSSELCAALRRMRDPRSRLRDRSSAALAPRLAEVMARNPDRAHAARYRRELAVVVDRPRAQFSAWYEMFPRSTGADGAHGTFRDAERRLEYVASMGFDVVYLPPIHPIGETNRKGRNNSLRSRPGDPGSPWAIGSSAGGHTSVHPELGSLDDFRRFREAAERLGMEVALDIAFQASPDHPWVRDHPCWFDVRPDGSIRYAENPPKRYQDIYPLDFSTDDWQALWTELLGVFRFWIEQGVRMFRVDNPHTKSLRFWEWCIAAIKADHPDVILLSEAFTKPSVMYALSKLGFSQSYTYFTWRASKHDLIHYMGELTRSSVSEFFRPNFWPNTPDILPEHLRSGRRSTFIARVALASTLSSNYGIYGPAFELREHIARINSGEYMNSEKYELRRWPIDRADSLRHVIRRLNRIRRDNPALHSNRLLAFHPIDNDQLLVYSKRTPDRSNVILVAVNLDPEYRQGGWVQLDLAELGLGWDEPFEVHDLVADRRYPWRGSTNYVELDPWAMPAHVFRIVRRRSLDPVEP